MTTGGSIEVFSAFWCANPGEGWRSLRPHVGRAGEGSAAFSGDHGIHSLPTLRSTVHRQLPDEERAANAELAGNSHLSLQILPAFPGCERAHFWTTISNRPVLQGQGSTTTPKH